MAQAEAGDLPLRRQRGGPQVQPAGVVIEIDPQVRAADQCGDFGQPRADDRVEMRDFVLGRPQGSIGLVGEFALQNRQRVKQSRGRVLGRRTAHIGHGLRYLGDRSTNGHGKCLVLGGEVKHQQGAEFFLIGWPHWDDQCRGGFGGTRGGTGEDGILIPHHRQRAGIADNHVAQPREVAGV
ncbi:MAG: hypothetical protein NT133_15220 [Alphaproteobacteria bacterium]|nr:hypothetical protein [Alphaproteobacteria bacterium]